MIRWAIHLGIYIAAIILLASCNFNSDLVIGSGNVVIENREVTEPFTKIDAGSATIVQLERSDKPYIRVEADDNLMPYIRTYVSNGTLHIGMRSIRLSQATKRTVYVGMPHLEALEASSASSVIGKSVFVSPKIDVEANSSATVQLEVETDLLEAESNSAGSIHLKGKALQAQMEANTAATIEAQELLVNTIVAEVNTAGTINCKPLAGLQGEANTGGSIYYYTTPKELSTQKNTGGNIEPK